MIVALAAVMAITVILWLPTLLLTINELIYYLAYLYREPEWGHVNETPLGRLSVIVPVKGEPLSLVSGLIASLEKVEWDKDDMELLMVSDDEEDAFAELERHVASMKPTFKVKIIRREKPSGGRTGALNEGLKHASGDYVLVIDVDSEVDPLFPRRAAALAKGDVAAVVSRWRGRNFDTLVSQAVSASMDFTVDCLWGGRQALGLPLYVIGSGTLFRADALRKLGGWCPLAPQDDMDMGAKMLRAGLKVKFIELTTLVENPSTYSVFRYQQSKWAYGTADVLRRRLLDVLRSPVDLWARLDSAAFLMQYMAIPTLFLAILVAGLGSALLRVDVMVLLWPLAAIHMGLLAVSSAFYGDSLKRRGFDVITAMIYAGRSSAIMGALAPHLLVASFKGLLRLPMNWRVTPKGRAVTMKGVPLEVFALSVFTAILLINLALGNWLTSLFLLIIDLPYAYVMIRFARDILT